MDGKEGLILQGCGGDLQEWLNGINEMFTEAGLLKNGTMFEEISAFENDGLTCLLYAFDGVELDIGKLAVWRLQTHETFGGTWLSDYVPNRLGGFIGEPALETEKPDCALIGQDGNIFNLVGIAARTLRRSSMADQAKEMSDRVFASGSYSEALCIIGEYVNITSGEEERKPSPAAVEKDSTGEIRWENKTRKTAGTITGGSDMEKEKLTVCGRYAVLLQSSDGPRPGARGTANL